MVDPRTLVLFGASRDLTRGMVMPTMFNVRRQGLLSRECRVIGYTPAPSRSLGSPSPVTPRH